MNILLSAMIMLSTSCGTDGEMAVKEAPFAPVTSPTNTSAPETANSTTNHFTAQTTVGEVIADAAFGDFGHLLFPVDRNVPSDMTLDEASSSSVYVYYTNIKAEKTVEIINYLRDEALAGRQIFFRFYSEAEIKADPTKSNTGLFFGSSGKWSDIILEKKKTTEQFVYLNHDKQMYKNGQQFSISCLGAL